MKASPKNLFILGILVVLLITIPLTLYFVKQQQDLRSSAAPSSALSLVATPTSLPVGETFSVDVMLDPGNNIPSFVKFTLSFDPQKVEVTEITPDPQNITSTLSGPNITESTATVDLGISKALTGYDPNADFNQPFKVATVKILAKQKTDTPTQISFDYPGQTEVYSLSADDSPGENVLQTASPVMLTILDGTTPSTTPSLSPSPRVSVTPSVSRTPTPSPTTAPNTPPVCTTLTANPASGSAALTTQLSATGNDSDGTIAKATFSFGDGQVVDVTEGMGTKTITAQQSHTYSTANNYNVSVVLTDDKGATSVACTQTVIVQAGTVTPPPATPTVIDAAPTTPPAIDAPGSFGTAMGVIGAVVLTVVGGLLFFAL